MDLYSEIILDHYKHPRNKGQQKNPTLKATEFNHSCGDKIYFYLTLDSKKKVSKATFEGEGCAISQAAASMLTKKLIDKSIIQIKKISNNDIYRMLGVKIGPGRIKCALLAISTIRKALNL